MKKVLAGVLVICLGSYGCAGRTPNPVSEYQYGDDKKSCNALRAEIANTESDIQRKLPEADKTGSNVALGVAGAFLLVPWFFMDFSKADQVEIEALRRSYNNLVILSSDKSCGFDYKPLPEIQKTQEMAASSPASSAVSPPASSPGSSPVSSQATSPADSPFPEPTNRKLREPF